MQATMVSKMMFAKCCLQLLRCIESYGQRPLLEMNSAFINRHMQSLGRKANRYFISKSHLRTTVCLSKNFSSLSPSGVGQRQCSKAEFKQSSLSITHRNISNTEQGPDSAIENKEEEEYGEYVREFCAIPGVGHRVLVIQPDIKTGSRRYVMTSRELKLEETCALVRTLPNWKVVEKRIVRTDHENTKNLFGSGNFEFLLREVRGKRNISAVVVGLDRLTGLQVHTLQKAWGLPVYDRYTVVLQIFREHAKSPEAKLQVALAEIPYIRSRLALLHDGSHSGPHVSHLVGGSTPMLMDRRRKLVQNREVKLKKELEKLHSQRQKVRRTRQQNDVPTVAVVGYTNAGKTTLIKALTNDENLQPENHLFATLDVTSHEGRLPSTLQVTYIDTVGFISDMPTTLLDAFKATLDDAMMADIVVHVRDASHPDRRLQIVTVHAMLKRMLNEDRMKHVIEVYNKVDLLSPENMEQLDTDILPISTVTGQGLSKLADQIEIALMANTCQMEKTFRIPNGGPMLEWLYKEAAVKSAIPDPAHSQYLIVKVIISKSSYGKFQSRFVRKS